ncbi:HEAT repeat domain-containing protein [Zavarzinella formosa]|uniref:HEAT repeat domain-containing protein n=1 Tax=Zavarzinella formosa TaxID=360055 RepID=UPI00030F40D8|nr:HEAT repeat domain-containing protein [Zavarzinella formosa]
MFVRRPFALAGILLLFGGLTLSAASKEEEAKKYADNLKSKDVKLRLQALTELAKLGSASLKFVTPYIDQITETIKDKDAKVRGEAGRTLGAIDPPDKKAAIEALTKALKDEKDLNARGNMEMGIGDLGAMTKEEDLKKLCLDSLKEARKNSTDKAEQKKIQAAMQTITGMGKKKN